jgi:Domain of unknown function (DUF4440)
MKCAIVFVAVLLSAAVDKSAVAADDPIAAVRALRAESNSAIAARDAKRLRKIFADDYLGIQGTSGALDSGGDATAQSYADVEFKDPTFVRYQRNPSSVQRAKSGKRIAESGRWEGVWRKADGRMVKSGVYLARWVPENDTWRLKSELFVTLDCRGSVGCAAAD